MSRAVVADEWALVRAGAEAVLRRNAFPKVITTEAALPAITASRDRSRPVSMVVLGAVSDMPLAEAVADLAAIDGVRVVVLFPPAEPQVMMELLERGAHAIVERQARDLDLPAAIEHARDGRRYVAPQLLGAMFDDTARLRPHNRPTFDLTRREQAVLAELVAGRSNAEIADRLSIAPETVKTHLTRLYAKLDVRRRSQAVAVAVKHDLLG